MINREMFTQVLRKVEQLKFHLEFELKHIRKGSLLLNPTHSHVSLSLTMTKSSAPEVKEGKVIENHITCFLKRL